MTIDGNCHICGEMLCLGCQDVGMIMVVPGEREQLCCDKCRDTFREMMPGIPR